MLSCVEEQLAAVVMVISLVCLVVEGERKVHLLLQQEIQEVVLVDQHQWVVKN